MEIHEALLIGGHAEIPDLLPPPPPWQRFAACVGDDVENYFVIADSETGRETLDVCSWCPVRDDCLQWALDHNEQGIWGGTSYTARERLRRDRDQAA